MNTLYDNVLYPDSVFSQTHPGRIGAIARILGLHSAPVKDCRVLELGCGGGNNLIAMAHGFPGSTFLGVDLAGRPLEQGRLLIEELGLDNIRLEHMDVCDFPEESGSFDYIIAHGLYSWVPNEVKDRILTICQAHLTPNGMAFISYNAYPGSHLRDIARGIMRYHARPLPDPEEQVKQGRALMSFLGEATPEDSLWHEVLNEQSKRISRYSDNGLFHDDLSDVNTALYFHEFMEQAERHRLQFLAEAEYHTMKPLGFTDSVLELLAQLEQSSLIKKEQYLDFLRGRGFRQTLLCHQSAVLDRNLCPERVHDLHVAADTTRTGPEGSSEDFQSQWGTVIGTRHPVAKAALTHLGEIWPRSVHFEELLRHSQSNLEKTGDSRREPAEEDRRDLGEFLLRCHELGFLEFHLQPCSFVTEVSERPTASRLCRLQLRYGNTVSNLRHRPVRLIDNLGQCLVQLLDGTRDRDALLAELKRGVGSGVITLHRDGKPIQEMAAALTELETNLDDNLASMARMALLVS